MGQRLTLALVAFAMASTAPLATAQDACDQSPSKASMVFVDLYTAASTALEAGQYGVALESAVTAAPYASGDKQTHAVILVRVAALWRLKETEGLEAILPALRTSPCSTPAQIADAEAMLRSLLDAEEQ